MTKGEMAFLGETAGRTNNGEEKRGTDGRGLRRDWKTQGRAVHSSFSVTVEQPGQTLMAPPGDRLKRGMKPEVGNWMRQSRGGESEWQSGPHGDGKRESGGRALGTHSHECAKIGPKGEGCLARKCGGINWRQELAGKGKIFFHPTAGIPRNVCCT